MKNKMKKLDVYQSMLNVRKIKEDVHIKSPNGETFSFSPFSEEDLVYLLALVEKDEQYQNDGKEESIKTKNIKRIKNELNDMKRSIKAGKDAYTNGN